MTIDDVVATFRQWLYPPDPAPLLAMLGAVAANRLEGDPVWLVLVGPPGGGKSELLASLTKLPNVHAAATLTEAALLSGTPNKEKANEAKGGLLREIGDFGIVVCKDFGSVLSMNRDARAALLAALREVYDGSWTRLVGTDGGRRLHWSGKVGLVAGCTPTIDRHHAVMGAMGERFVLLRISESESNEQARRALAHAGREGTMRAELGAATEALLAKAPADPRRLDDEEVDRLIAITTLVVRARSAVERDGHTREVELVPDPEAPTRLIVVLERLLAGLDSIGVDRPVAWRVVTKAALDSIPALRRKTIETLYLCGELETGKVAEAVAHPTQTTRRALEDLTAHGLVNRRKQGDGKAHHWSLDPFANVRFEHAMTPVPETSEPSNNGSVPETSEPLSSPHHVYDDISGKATLS